MAQGNKFWVTNIASADKAEIFIYGTIGAINEVTASSFVTELRMLEKNYGNIDIRINSVGGDVFDGLAIINAIRQSNANINGYNDGIAASMGAMIYFAIPKRYMNKYARIMTHKASGGSLGHADDIQRLAELLRGVDDDLCEMLAQITGLSKDATMAKYLSGVDKWIKADEALKDGLIHGTYDGKVVDAPATASLNEMFAIYNAAVKLPSVEDNISAAKKLIFGKNAIQVPAPAAAVNLQGRLSDTEMRIYNGKTYDELSKEDKLHDLLCKSPLLFAKKYEAQHGRPCPDLYFETAKKANEKLNALSGPYEGLPEHVYNDCKAKGYDALMKADKLLAVYEKAPKLYAQLKANRAADNAKNTLQYLNDNDFQTIMKANKGEELAKHPALHRAKWEAAFPGKVYPYKLK